MKKLMILVLLISTNLFANKKLTSELNKIESEQTSESLEKYKQLLENSSIGNRMNKEKVFTVNPVGASFGSSSWGAELGWFLDTNTILSAEATIMRGDNSNDELFNQDREGTAFSVGLKKFTGNSFYIKPSLSYRNQKDVTSVTYNFDPNTPDFATIAEIEDLVVSFRIGNQWQWENLTIGCDWIGLSQSVIELSSEGDVSDLETFATALNFYIGMSF